MKLMAICGGLLFFTQIIYAEIIDIRAVNFNIKCLEVCVAPAMGHVLARTGEFLVQKKLAYLLDDVQKDLEKNGFGLQVFYLMASREVPPYIGQRFFGDDEIHVTLLDYKTGKELLPTPFGCDSKKVDHAHMTPEEQKNCNLLCATMKQHSLKPVANEWWHFILT